MGPMIGRKCLAAGYAIAMLSGSSTAFIPSSLSSACLNRERGRGDTQQQEQRGHHFRRVGGDTLASHHDGVKALICAKEAAAAAAESKTLSCSSSSNSTSRRELLQSVLSNAVVLSAAVTLPRALRAEADAGKGASESYPEVLGHIREVMQDWSNVPDEAVTIKPIKGGITNTIFRAYPNGDKTRGLLIRVYGKDTDLLLDRRRENAVFQELAKLGFGPKFYGEFERGKGRIEELLDARAATVPELLQRSPFDVPKAVASQLAILHKQTVKSAGDAAHPVMWATIDKWLATLKDLESHPPPNSKGSSSSAFDLPLSEVEREVKWLKKALEDRAREAKSALKLAQSRTGGGSGGSGARSEVPTTSEKVARALAIQFSDGIVFAHNDLLSGNVLVGPPGDKKQQQKKGSKPPVIQTLRLIDYEYSNYNPRGYDLANHLCECAGFEGNFERDFPSHDQTAHLVQCYSAASGDLSRMTQALLPYHQLPNQGQGAETSGAVAAAVSPTANAVAAAAVPVAVAAATTAVVSPTASAAATEEAQALVVSAISKAVKEYTLTSHLTWALWAQIQARTSEIDFSFAEYAQVRWRGYHFHKRELFS